MLISDSHRLILMLPQKCGSSTLSNRLHAIHDVENYGVRAQFIPELGKSIGKHIPLEDAFRTEAFRTRYSYLKACFARNPYDRAYSWFEWWREASPKTIKKVRAKLETPEHRGDPGLELILANARKRTRLLEQVDHDYSRFLEETSGQLPPVSRFTHYKGRRVVDFVGHLERFEQDFEALCRKIEFEEAGARSRNTRGTNRVLGDPTLLERDQHKYLDRYSAKAVKLVNEQYATDFLLLGHRRFDPAEFD